MPLFRVGLTGGIGSGKTTAAKRFEEHGVTLINTDQISRRLTAAGGEAMSPIQQQFGDTFILPNGALNRSRMRAHIFSDEYAKQQLETILRPLILAICDDEARHASGLYIMFEVPLLVESGHWDTRVQRVLLIDCDEETQIARVMQRSNLTREQVQAIIARQTTRQARQKRAQDIIMNTVDTSLAQLYEKVDALHAYYLNLSLAMH